MLFILIDTASDLIILRSWISSGRVNKMNLDEIRKEIDGIDGKLLDLFAERMKLCEQVAEYKAQNKMEIFQGGREQQVLDNISGKSPQGLETASRLLFSQIMEISKCLQQQRITEFKSFECAEDIAADPVIACPGIGGSYSEEACIKKFGEKARIEYYNTFEQVFMAVDSGNAVYGVLPIENSTAGSVDDTYSLLERYDVHICGRLSIPVNHVLAAKNKSEPKIVVSHRQALHQCSEFIKSRGYTTQNADNTSIAAKSVSESLRNDTACICSAHCAELYGLEILADDIADSNENHTRFIIVSKELRVEENADVVSICLSLPHISGSLYKLLTRFYFAGLNLTRIESRHMSPYIKKKAGTDGFEVVFYLDFEGSLTNAAVGKLLRNLEKDCGYYKLLGSYKDIN